MSHIASIDIYYETRCDISVPEIIDLYISHGWNLNDYGHISLRPLGDKDDFSWINLELNQIDELYEIIRKKVEAGEDPSVVLMLDNMETGAVTTFYPQKKRIDFLLMIGKKFHSELSGWTDVSWYLPYIYKPLEVKNKVGVCQIEFSEYL
jgi:hypothetical protein